MDSYDRITSALAGKTCDRVPCDMWATDEVVERLKRHFGADTERGLYGSLGVDKIVWVSAPYADLPAPAPGMSGTSAWGVQYRDQAYGGGTYREAAYAPLARMESVRDYERHLWPDPDRFDYRALADRVEAERGCPLMLEFISLFEIYTAMRGFENALADLYVEREMAHRALERIAEVQLAYIDRALDAAGDGIDLVYFSDDMGMQDRQLFPAEVWAEFIGPRAERIIDLVHLRGRKVFYHTDGSAPEIVDRLVGMGIDVLNPIQYVCPGMERERLKALYGGRVVFHGAVENQRVLPFGTPAEVKRETLECIELLGSGGGYIVAPCHNLQPNTPTENILAMYEAVAESAGG